MIRRPPRSTQSRSSAASDVYKRQSSALAEPSIELSLAAPLSAVGAPLEVNLSASLGGRWVNASTVVEVRGPGSPMAGGTEGPVTARVESAPGDLEAGVSRLTVTLEPTDLPE